MSFATSALSKAYYFGSTSASAIQAGLRIYGIGSAPYNLSQSGIELEEEFSKPENGRDNYNTTVEFLQTATTIANTIADTLETSRDIERIVVRFNAFIIDPILSFTDSAQRILDSVKKVPVKQVANVAKALEAGVTALETSVLSIEVPADQVEERLEAINAKVAGYEKALSKFGQLGKPLFILDLAQKQVQDAIQRAKDLVIQVEQDIQEASREFTDALEQAVGPDNPGEAILVLPDTILAEVTERLAIWDARFDNRTGEFNETVQKATETFNKVENALQGGSIQKFADDIEGALNDMLDKIQIGDALDGLNKLDVLTGPINDVLAILDYVVKAVQPVLDVFGPATEVLNKTLEKIEKAVGLSELENVIREQITDLVDAITQPIRDTLQGIVNVDIDLSGIDQLSDVIEEVTSLTNLAKLLGATPLGDVGTVGADRLSGVSILSGREGDDVLSLSLDSRYDDGQGGYGLGGAGDDEIRGTRLQDLIFGGDGNDLLLGREDNDLVFGGAGDDQILLGSGDDKSTGGTGMDEIRGGEGNDRIFGDTGNDMLFGDAGDDLLDGGLGDDFLDGGTGNDAIFGGGGVDTITSTAGENVLDGGEGLDVIRTLGDVDAVHTIFDVSVILTGGAGEDIVVAGDAFAAGAVIPAGIFFDGGSNFDTFEAGNLDLASVTGLIANFDQLRIQSDDSSAKTLSTSKADLLKFDVLALAGGGPLTVEFDDADWDMNLLSTQKAFRFDTTDLVAIDNPFDGIGVQDLGETKSRIFDLTLKATNDGGIVLSAIGNIREGLILEGANGADTIIGGLGSDIIRGGLGADQLDGGQDDAGNRFRTDAAVGDVFVGTLAEFEGDFIRNLTNRTDRIRIETDLNIGQVSSQITGGDTIVTVGGIQFRIEGEQTKLVSREISVDGTRFIELFNNNVPPVAEPDDFVVDQGPGGGVTFDPVANDRDPDALPGQKITLDDATYNVFLQESGLQDGESLTTTRLGGILTRVGDELIYRPGQDPTEFRRVTEQENVRLGGNYDITEDVPFFGFDRVTYRVKDAEGELSNTSSLDFLVTPDSVDVNGNPTPTRAVISSANGDAGVTATLRESEVHIASGSNGQIDFFSVSGGPVFSNRSGSFFGGSNTLQAFATGNDEINVVVSTGDIIVTPTEYYQARPWVTGGSGNDVLIASTPVSTFLDGGANADWIQGGDGDDYISGGLVDDYVIPVQTRSDIGVELRAENTYLQPNILAGGAGHNVYVKGEVSSGLNRDFQRDDIFILEGEAEVIIGSGGIGFSQNGLRANGANRASDTADAAAALQDDRFIGFDPLDKIILPFARQSVAGLEEVSVNFRDELVNLRDGVFLTKADVSQFLGQTADQVLNTPGNPFSSGGWDTRVAIQNTDGSWRLNPDFNGLPLLIQYDVIADSTDPDGGASAATNVTVFLKSYFFDPGANRTNDVGATAQLVESRPGFLSDSVFPSNMLGLFGQGDGFVLPQAVPASGRGIEDADIRFTMEFDGFYRDRFSIDLATVTQKPQASFNAGLEVRNAPTFAPLEYFEGQAEPGTFATPFLSISYTGSGPVAGDVGTLQVERGGAQVFDLLSRVTDADGDAVFLRSLEFTDAGEQTSFTDGDLSNGELIIQIDPEVGLGTGLVTFYAPDDFIGRAGFTGVTTDLEFESQLSGRFESLGKTPELGDDLVILPFNAGNRILINRLLENDSDPDVEIGLEPSVALDSANFQFVDNPLGLDLRRTQPGSSDFSVFLTSAVLNDLRANPVDEQGAFGSTAEFTYTMADITNIPFSNPAGLSEPATVQVAVAAPFTATGQNSFSVAEDSTVIIDLIENRAGGYGDVTATLFSKDVRDVASGEIIGTAEISGSDLTVTPLADLAGGTGRVRVFLTDELGSRVQRDITVAITPVDDAAIARIVGPTDAGRLAVNEDEVITGEILIFDADALGLGDVAFGSLKNYLSLATDNTALGSLGSISAQLGATAAAPVSLGPILSDLESELTLSPTGNPLVYTYKITPSTNLTGRDDFTFAVVSPDGSTSDVTFGIDIAPVNDRPFLLIEPETTIIGIGDTVAFDLPDTFRDIEGEVVRGSLVIESAPDAAIATLAVDANGVATLTGVASGEGSFSYSVADAEGARSDPATVFFDINLAPVAAADFASVFAPSQSILIDAIGNDTDTDGTITYVLGEDGLPAIFDPRVSLNPDAVSELSGTVTWSEPDQSLIYTAPADLAAFGVTDLFAYEIRDNDGFTTRATIAVDLVASSPDNPFLRIIEDTQVVADATEAVEGFVLGAGPDELRGTLAELDNDEIFDFQPNDRLMIDGLSAANPLTLELVREVAPLAAGEGPTGDATTPGGIFGTTPFDLVSTSFQGITILRVSDGTSSAEISLKNAYPGTFTLSALGAETSTISYAPSITGDGTVTGTPLSDDISGGDGDDFISGFDGDDVLRGNGGDDILEGGDGSDILIGGEGRNILTGGDGADLFVVNSVGVDGDGAIFDVITDYNPGEGDRIVFTADGFLNDDLSFVTDRAEIVETGTSADGRPVFELRGVSLEDTDPNAAPTTLFAFSTISNQAPEFTTPASLVVLENETDVAEITAVDADLDPLTYSVSGGADASLFVINEATGDLSFLAAPDFETPTDQDGDNVYQVQVTVSDGQDTADRLFEITVTNVDENIAPVAKNDTYATGFNATLTVGAFAGVLVNDQDADADPLTAEILTETSDGAISLNADGSFEYIPDAGFSGTDSFSYTALDGQGGSDIATVSITVAPNIPPEAQDGFASGNEDTIISGTLLATDADGGVLAYSLGTVVQNGTATVNTDGTFSYLPDPDFFGTDSFGFAVDDGFGGTDSGIVTLTVVPVNDAPILTANANVPILENTTAVQTLTATDVDGDALTFAIAGGADEALFQIDPDSGALSFTDAVDFEQPGDAGADNIYDVTVAVSDGENTASQQITVSVNNVQEPPELTAPAEISFRAVPFAGFKVADIDATDPDGDDAAITFSITGGSAAAGLAIDAQTGIVTIADAALFGTGRGPFDLEVTATDDEGVQASALIGITIAPFDQETVTNARFVTGSAGNDLIEAGSRSSFIFAGDGDDVVLTAARINWVFGQGGEDALYGGDGRNQLYGGTGNDFLDGGDGRDSLFGQSGDDFLVGGAGNDLLFGGSGNDVFVMGTEGGFDTIVDFVIGVDVIDLTARNIAFDDLELTGGRRNTLIEDGDLTILLRGVDAAELTADSFIF